MQERVNYNDPVQIADGVYWVGYADEQSGLHCNPYLIVDGDEAVVIDGGSRPDFPTVMLKILQSGVTPKQISTLIYQHYDPDLCGSIPNFEDIVGREDLRLISDKENNVFIRHYYVTSRILALESIDFCLTFGSGRRLEFFRTPYCHSAGSFITFDTKTGVLFTSDIFGSISRTWDLFLTLHSECRSCTPPSSDCSLPHSECPLLGIMNFHRRIMPSNRALHNALRIVSGLPFETIAPQHGSIIRQREDITAVAKTLLELPDVGIDGVPDACAPCDAGAIADAMAALREPE